MCIRDSSQLDPSLRDFLEKESNTQNASQPAAARSKDVPRSSEGASTKYRNQLGITVPGTGLENQDHTTAANAPAVPPESLFQDGRYAHLWKGYRPQADVEAAAKTDQDRLADVVDLYRDRKAAIGRAALENCVMEQMAEKECFANGGWKKMMGMCRTENKDFNRCYAMQSKFLKALGYLAGSYTTAEEEERIQMHADKLYHEMLERERVMEEAKKEGKEAPNFGPLLSQDRVLAALGDKSAYARARKRAQDEMLPTNLFAYPPDKQEEIKERLKGLSEQQKEIEMQLIAAESRAQLEYVDLLKERFEEERVHRAERRERGRETVGDTIKRWSGWQQ